LPFPTTFYHLGITSDIAVSPSYPPHLQHEYYCHPLHQTLPQARRPHRSPDQAYNLLAAKYFDHILGGIGASTIAALGTVAPGSYKLSYIYAPQVHTDLSGNFLGFVGNASNKIGEFSCVHIHKDSLGLFQIIDSKANLEEAVPGHLSTVIPFSLDLLTNTDRANPSDDISGALFPNFFIIYFWCGACLGGSKTLKK
jgi:hypothetical protein